MTMNALENPDILFPWLISNIAAVLILWAAWKRPRLGRLMLFLLFAWACWVNFTTARQSPEVYLEYASMSAEWYSRFIMGWFKEHITAMVTVIAAGQALIAIGMILHGWWVRTACIGTIIFLLAIAPLGVGAGFPFSITVSIAALLILRKDNLNFLWKPDREGQATIQKSRQAS